MNEQQAENLRILIRHMETRVTRTLNMACYFDNCRAPACAWGEASTIPALVAQGVKHGASLLDAPEVFGLEHTDYDNHPVTRLFGTSRVNAWKRNDVTPQEWAIEARKVLAEHGYTMEPPPHPVEPDKWRTNGGLEIMRDYDRAQRGE